MRTIIGLRDADYLNSGKRITLLFGGSHTGHAAMRKTAITYGHCIERERTSEYDNPYYVGLTGLIGYSSGYHAVKDCDVLLMLGTDFPYRQFYPKDATVLQVDIEPGHLGRLTDLTYGLCGDVKATIEVILKK